MGLSHELFWVKVSHVGNEMADYHVDPKSKDNNYAANNDSESHLVNFSLLYALLPNVKLEWWLKWITLLTDGPNVPPKPVIDGL